MLIATGVSCRLSVREPWCCVLSSPTFVLMINMIRWQLKNMYGKIDRESNCYKKLCTEIALKMEAVPLTLTWIKQSVCASVCESRSYNSYSMQIEKGWIMPWNFRWFTLIIQYLQTLRLGRTVISFDLLHSTDHIILPADSHLKPIISGWAVRSFRKGSDLDLMVWLKIFCISHFFPWLITPLVNMHTLFLVWICLAFHHWMSLSTIFYT